MVKFSKKVQERIASLTLGGKSLKSIDLLSVSNKKDAMSTFMSLKVRDALSKISATKNPFTSETLKISPSDSKNIGKVTSAINENLTSLIKL